MALGQKCAGVFCIKNAQNMVFRVIKYLTFFPKRNILFLVVKIGNIWGEVWSMDMNQLNISQNYGD